MHPAHKRPALSLISGPFIGSSGLPPSPASKRPRLNISLQTTSLPVALPAPKCPTTPVAPIHDSSDTSMHRAPASLLAAVNKEHVHRSSHAHSSPSKKQKISPTKKKLCTIVNSNMPVLSVSNLAPVQHTISPIGLTTKPQPAEKLTPFVTPTLPSNTAPVPAVTANGDVPIARVVSEWGLPTLAFEFYRSTGIHFVYEWQYQCLHNYGLLEGRNFVFSMPTSSGKSLVAEFALLRCVHVRKKKALLVLPFVSMVQEKTKHIEGLGLKIGFATEPYYSSHGIFPVPPGSQLLVATIEKANAVVNDLIESKRLDEIGCVVIDEVHMLGEPQRGYILELLLAKLLFVATGTTQIMAMSATISNLSDISTWLSAQAFEAHFRPVKLKEYVVIGKNVFNRKGKLRRSLECEAARDDCILLVLFSTKYLRYISPL